MSFKVVEPILNRNGLVWRWHGMAVGEETNVILRCTYDIRAKLYNFVMVNVGNTSHCSCGIRHSLWKPSTSS